MSRTLRKITWAGWTCLARWASRSYLAGPELEDALRVGRRLARHGFATTVGYWNREGDEAQDVAERYSAAIHAMAREELDCYLSIKAPALGLDEGLVTGVIKHSERAGVQLHFDSLGPEATDEVFAIIARSHSPSRRMGCTLPGRWHRSRQDADTAIALGLNVRVVKGQWRDPEDPDINPRDGFLEVIDQLAGRARHVRVATHDAPLAREALRKLRAANTSCELELLFGLPMKAALEATREVGVPVRLYVPYGTAFVPYCLNQIRKRPRILWWLFQDAVFGRSLNLLNTVSARSPGTASPAEPLSPANR